MENGKEDEEGVYDEGHDVGKGGEREGHVDAFRDILCNKIIEMGEVDLRKLDLKASLGSYSRSFGVGNSDQQSKQYNFSMHKKM